MGNKHGGEPTDRPFDKDKDKGSQSTEDNHGQARGGGHSGDGKKGGSR
ncbi:hypothetical protein [Nonomuraea sp. GTA35]